MPLKRVCGSCHACCGAFAIPELEKDERTMCQHVDPEAGNCSIYADRPEPCQTFKCAWLEDDRSRLHYIHDRPDRLGLILSMIKSKVGPLWAVREIREGASETKRGKAFIERFRDSSAVPVIVTRWDNSRVILGGPRSAQILHQIQRLGSIDPDP